MPSPYSSKDISPELDASMGLIFRLNILWSKVDRPAEDGDYDHWNIILDRIYCNLLYRNEIEVVKDSKGNITSIKLDDDDEKIYLFLSQKVAKWKMLYKKFYAKNKTNPQLAILRSNWYKSIMLKDIWLRKFMQKLKLYVKETNKAPGTALFGSFSGKKR